MIHTHGQLGILFLEDAAELDEVGTTTQVTGLSEVAIGEDMAGAQMNEMGAGSELLSEIDYIIICTCGKGSCTEGEAVMLVGHSIEEPLDILLSADDARQTKQLIAFIKEQLAQRELFYNRANYSLDVSLMDNYEKIKITIEKLRELLQI